MKLEEAIQELRIIVKRSGSMGSDEKRLLSNLINEVEKGNGAENEELLAQLKVNHASELGKLAQQHSEELVRLRSQTTVANTKASAAQSEMVKKEAELAKVIDQNNVLERELKKADAKIVSLNKLLPSS